MIFRIIFWIGGGAVCAAILAESVTATRYDGAFLVMFSMLCIGMDIAHTAVSRWPFLIEQDGDDV